MPLDTEALDHFALGVTESLAGPTARCTQAELDQHGKAFAGAIAAVRSVFLLSDARQPPERRRRALSTALRDLFDCLSRRGTLVATVDELVENRTPEAPGAPGTIPGTEGGGGGGDADLVRLLARLSGGPTGDAPPADAGPAAEQLIARGRLAAEIGWFLDSAVLTDARLGALTQRLGGNAAGRLLDSAQAWRKTSAADARLVTPHPTAVTALVMGGPSPPSRGGGTGEALPSRVDAAVQTAARRPGPLAAYRAMRSGRQRLQRSAWGLANAQLRENTVSLASLATELLTGAGSGGIARRLRRTAQRQARLVGSLPRLRDDYEQMAEAHSAAERRWRAAFREQVAGIAAQEEWGELDLLYLAEEYPQLAIDTRSGGAPVVGVRGGTAERQPAEDAVGPAVPVAERVEDGELLDDAETTGEIADVEAPPSAEPYDGSSQEALAEEAAVADGEIEIEDEEDEIPPPPPPADNRVVRLPRAPTPPPDPGYGSALAPPPGPEAVVTGPAAEPWRDRLHRAVGGYGRPVQVGVALTVAAASAAIGFGVALIGHVDGRPSVPVSTVLTTLPAPQSPRSNHVSVHVPAVAVQGGGSFGPVDETNPVRSVQCSGDEVTLSASTVAGERYDVRLTGSVTELIIGGHQVLSGPAVPTSGGGTVEGVSLLAANSGRTHGSVTVHAACAGSAVPAVTMVDSIPSGAQVSSPAIPPRVAWDPGRGGYLAGGILVILGASLVMGSGVGRQSRIAGPLLIGIGSALVAFGVHSHQLATAAVEGSPASLALPGCSGCPGDIRFTSLAVERRPGGQLVVLGGSWPAEPAAIPADLRLVANDVAILLRPRQDPRGFQLVSSVRSGMPLPAGTVAAGLRPGALLIAISDSVLTPPMSIEVGLWKDDHYLGRLPSGGSLTWEGKGAPVARPLGPGVPPQTSDLTRDLGRCPSLSGGKVPADLLPDSQLTGTAPDLTSGAPLRYYSVYFRSAGFTSGLAGHPPLTVVLAIQRSAMPGTGVLPIDHTGDVQLWAEWDGHQLHRALRTFAGSSWALRQDDASTGVSVEIRKQGVVFFWRDGRAGDRHGFVASDGSACASLGLDPQGTPALGQ